MVAATPAVDGDGGSGDAPRHADPDGGDDDGGAEVAGLGGASHEGDDGHPDAGGGRDQRAPQDEGGEGHPDHDEDGVHGGPGSPPWRRRKSKVAARALMPALIAATAAAAGVTGGDDATDGGIGIDPSTFLTARTHTATNTVALQPTSSAVSVRGTKRSADDAADEIETTKT